MRVQLDKPSNKIVVQVPNGNKTVYAPLELPFTCPAGAEIIVDEPVMTEWGVVHTECITIMIGDKMVWQKGYAPLAVLRALRGASADAAPKAASSAF